MKGQNYQQQKRSWQRNQAHIVHLSWMLQTRPLLPSEQLRLHPERVIPSPTKKSGAAPLSFFFLAQSCIGSTAWPANHYWTPGTEKVRDRICNSRSQFSSRAAFVPSLNPEHLLGFVIDVNWWQAALEHQKALTGLPCP